MIPTHLAISSRDEGRSERILRKIHGKVIEKLESLQVLPDANLC